MRVPLPPGLGRAELRIKRAIRRLGQRHLAQIAIRTDEQTRHRPLGPEIAFQRDLTPIGQRHVQVIARPDIACQLELPEIEGYFLSGRDFDDRYGHIVLDHATPGCARDGTHDKIHCLHTDTALLVTRRLIRQFIDCGQNKTICTALLEAIFTRPQNPPTPTRCSGTPAYTNHMQPDHADRNDPAVMLSGTGAPNRDRIVGASCN